MSFQKKVQNYLDELASTLEALDFDVDYADLTLSFAVEEGLYLFKVHQLTEEIWLSSPQSGGHRFSYDSEKKCWVNIRNGLELEDFLTKELHISFLKT